MRLKMQTAEQNLIRFTHSRRADECDASLYNGVLQRPHDDLITKSPTPGRSSHSAPLPDTRLVAATVFCPVCPLEFFVDGRPKSGRTHGSERRAFHGTALRGGFICPQPWAKRPSSGIAKSHMAMEREMEMSDRNHSPSGIDTRKDAEMTRIGPEVGGGSRIPLDKFL